MSLQEIPIEDIYVSETASQKARRNNFQHGELDDLNASIADHDGALKKHLKQLSEADLPQFLNDAIYAGELQVSGYNVGRRPKALEEAAGKVPGVNAKAIRRQVTAKTAPKKKAAKKGAKKKAGKKTPRKEEGGLMATNHHNGAGRLTNEDRARIEVLAEQGLGSHRIARRIGRHPSTVNWYMYSAGLRAPQPAPEKPASYLRNGRRVHRFTAEEDAFVTALRTQNFGLDKIAELATKRYGTNRTAHTVRMRLTMLAARDEEAA